MKKLALALVFGALSVGAVSAQTTEKKAKVKTERNETKIKREGAVAGKHNRGNKEMKSPEERADRQTKVMVEKLGLTNDQASRIKELNLRKAQQMQALKAKYGEQRKGMGAEMQDIKNTWHQDLKNVLSAEQYAKFQAQQEERKAKMKARREAGKGKKEFRKDYQKS
ncbi:DUF4890 domain-containing protein [Adhaeribacter soli]|uniref:DUF4890 domain-containing protein n=1 Tax=Adhaeribacter soli TaxID=2607655 RepID=A0A5N1J9R3_9BACT|nr:DUF4890 domain-containing protein [Adhaeribacter soli]KAA9345738.1 DUF4890 domain-containing protein [Adhaeribacter soli]